MSRCISPVTYRKGNTVNTYPCGKCNFCLSNRRSDWTFRIWQEVKASKSAYFITLTYSDENQPTKQIGDDEKMKVGTLNKKHFQDFMKRLRKANEQEKVNPTIYDTSAEWPPIKYYAVGEYGEKTFRPHYHAIITNVKPATIAGLSKTWGLGNVSVGTPDVAAIHYTTKYVIQPTGEDIWTPLLPPFSLISKGVGKAYLDTNGFHHKETRQNFVFGDRGKQRIPRYYADRIWSVRDKEFLQKSSVEQSDIIYRRVIESGVTPGQIDKITHDKHEQIFKTIKNANNNNETI